MNVIVSFSPGFNKAQVHLSVFAAVRFISYKEKWKSFWIFRSCLILKVALPLGNIFKALWTSNIVYKHTRFSASIERDTQTLISFLSSCVPYLSQVSYSNTTYLESDSFDLVTDGDLDLLAMEIGTDGRLVHLRDCLLDVSTEKVINRA